MDCWFLPRCRVQFSAGTQTQDFWECESSPLPSYISSTNAGMYDMYELVMCMHAWERGADFNCFPWLLSTSLFYSSIYLFLRQGLWMDLELTNLARPAGLPAHALQGSIHVHPASSEVNPSPSFHLSAACRSSLLPAITTLLTKLSAPSPETAFLIYDFILLSKVQCQKANLLYF